MWFLHRHPVPLNELLLSPVLYRETVPALDAAPLVSRSGMRDLAQFAGHSAGAIRTAMSRLRSAGSVEVAEDELGVVRYRTSPLVRSVVRAVFGRPGRPDGFLLAVFSFSTGDTRERHVVRDALRIHGFQKLAQNVYVNGQIDTAELEATFDRHGLSERVFLFRCPASDDPSLRARLTELFDLGARAEALRQLGRDLEAFLDDPALDGDTFARRLLYAGPVHHQVTYVDEPWLPAGYLPADYPLDAVVQAMMDRTQRRAPELLSYFQRVNQA